MNIKKLTTINNCKGLNLPKISDRRIIHSLKIINYTTDRWKTIERPTLLLVAQSKITKNWR